MGFAVFFLIALMMARILAGALQFAPMARTFSSWAIGFIASSMVSPLERCFSSLQLKENQAFRFFCSFKSDKE